MPRSRKHKNSYCRGSKLTDEVFEHVLIEFLQGSAATEAEVRLKKRFADQGPPEKTIRRHYKRIGLALYERIFETILLNQLPELRELKNSNESMYKSQIEHLLQLMHEWFITSRPNQFDDGIAWQDTMAAYRRLSNGKNGVRDGIREHMALAALWACARGINGDNRAVGYKMSFDAWRELFEMVAKMLKEKRC